MGIIEIVLKKMVDTYTEKLVGKLSNLWNSFRGKSNSFDPLESAKNEYIWLDDHLGNGTAQQILSISTSHAAKLEISQLIKNFKDSAFSEKSREALSSALRAEIADENYNLSKPEKIAAHLVAKTHNPNSCRYKLKLANLYFDTGKLHDAEQLINDVEISILGKKESNEHARLHGIKGKIFYEQKEYDKAIEQLKKSEHISKRNDDSEGAAKAQGQIAKVFLLRNDFEQALMYINHSIVSNEGNKLGLGRNYNFKGKVFRRRSEYKLAGGEYLKALEIFTEKNSTSDRLNTMCSIAQLGIDRNLFEKAKKALAGVSKEALDKKQLFVCARAQSMLAGIASDENEIYERVKHSEKAYKLVVGTKEWKARVRYGIDYIEAVTQLGNFKKALTLIKEVQGTLRDVPQNVYFLTTLAIIELENYIKQGDVNSAKKLYKDGFFKDAERIKLVPSSQRKRINDIRKELGEINLPASSFGKTIGDKANSSSTVVELGNGNGNEGRLLYDQGQHLLKSGDSKGAAEAFDGAGDLQNKAEKFQLAAISFFTAAKHYREIGSYDRAYETDIKSIKCNENAKQYDWSVRISSKLIQNLVRTNPIDRAKLITLAELLFSNLIKLELNNVDDLDFQQVVRTVGILVNELDGKLLHHVNASELLREEAEKRKTANLHADLCGIVIRQKYQGGENSEVRELIESYIRKFENVDDNSRQGFRLFSLGEFFEQKGWPHQAIKLFGNARLLNRINGSKQFEARSTYAMAKAMEATGNLKQALVHYKENLEIQKKLGDDNFLAMAAGHVDRIKQLVQEKGGTAPRSGRRTSWLRNHRS